MNTLTQENREGKWASPERQEDLKYQERMKEFFSPSSTVGASRNGAGGGPLRHPLTEDTAVLDPVEHGRGHETPAGGYAREGEPGGEHGFRGESVQDTGKPDLRRVLLFALGALAVIVFFLLVAWLLFGRGGGEPGQEQQETPAAAPAASEPIETNLTFKVQSGEGEAYAIRMGEYEWEGTKGMNGDVEEVVLEGRTAAHFTTAVQLADGEITTGVFGRAEPNRPLWHATYQRTRTDGQRATTGTYQAIEEKRVVLEGAYTDRIVEDNPGDEPDVIVREYVEGDPREGEEEMKRFSAEFSAEKGAEVPWLPGNPIAEGGAEGGEQE